jgi:hypothetical protein
MPEVGPRVSKKRPSRKMRTRMCSGSIPLESKLITGCGPSLLQHSSDSSSHSLTCNTRIRALVSRRKRPCTHACAQPWKGHDRKHHLNPHHNPGRKGVPLAAAIRSPCWQARMHTRRLITRTPHHTNVSHAYWHHTLKHSHTQCGQKRSLCTSASTCVRADLRCRIFGADRED